ncbi:MAG: hypothetical protein NTV88_00830 [Candidatus Micrarchaeota archaeon]|nr:hypothetical protein [Candidatus Micrarchaeota archaeon]
MIGKMKKHVEEHGYGLPVYVLICLLLLSLSFGIVSKYKQIPSPLYGGDYYKGLGDVTHIVDGGSVFESSQMKGEVPLAPGLYFLLVAIFTWASGMTAMAAMLNFALIVDLMTLAIFYYLVKELTGNNYLPALAVLLAFGYGFSPVIKYSFFSSVVSMPLFILAFYLFLRKPEMKSAAPTGLALGIAGLSNSQAFFMAFMIFFVAALVLLLPKLFDFKTRKLTLDESSKDALKLYAIIFAIGFLLSLLFWFRPIFIYHGATPNDIQNITVPDVKNPTLLWGSVFDLFNNAILPFRSGVMMVFTLFNLLGIYYVWKTRKEFASLFVLILLAAWFIAIIHPLVNFMMSDQVYPTITPLLICFGLVFANERLKKQSVKLLAIGFAILLIAAYLGYADYWNARGASQYEQSGAIELSAPFMELQTWIRGNTAVNDVFLTTNEDGFMMNALTGRKVVSYRRAHASPYVDMHTRMADEAVMVYGTNSAETGALLKKYDVKYLLWTNRWVLNEFQFDANGQLQGFFDPLTVPANKSNAQYWAANGVKFMQFTMPMDPAPRTGVPTYNQLIAIPYNVSNEPLSPVLYNDFQLVKVVSYNGQDVFRIYEIRG